MTNYYIIPFLLFTYFLSFAFIRSFMKLLSNTRAACCFTDNYKGKQVPILGGAVYLPILLASLSVFIFFHYFFTEQFVTFLFFIGMVGFSGLLDDMIGDKETKGLKRHILSTLKGNLTTGFLKAFLTGLAAFVICCRLFESVSGFFLNFFLMILFTNLLNLLDLRPGRSIKAYYLFTLPLFYFFTALEPVDFLPFLIIAIITLVYLPYDLKELCMLGDTGSNILGASLGYYYVISAPGVLKLMLLFSLVCIHIAAERVSLSNLIKRNRFLSYIDRLGRSVDADDKYQPRHC